MSLQNGKGSVLDDFTEWERTEMLCSPGVFADSPEYMLEMWKVWETVKSEKVNKVKKVWPAGQKVKKVQSLP